jgi:hypothetical protein
VPTGDGGGGGGGVGAVDVVVGAVVETGALVDVVAPVDVEPVPWLELLCRFFVGPETCAVVPEAAKPAANTRTEAAAASFTDPSFGRNEIRLNCGIPLLGDPASSGVFCKFGYAVGGQGFARAFATAVISVGTWIYLPAAGTEAAGTQAVWRGDYDTGNFSQWSELQASRTNRTYSTSAVGDSAGTIVGGPVREGAHAAKFVTYPHESNSPTDRAEVYTSIGTTQGLEGRERYYAWSTMFPAAGNDDGFWSRGGDFNVFTQWYSTHNTCGGGPNVQFGIDARPGRGGSKIYADLSSINSRDCDGRQRSTHKTLGRLRFDVWYDFIAHIKWSTNPSVGFLEVWMDGVQVVPKTFARTIADSQGAYWKQGFYRAPFSHTNTVYQDAAIIGPTLPSVTRAFKLAFVGRPTLGSSGSELDISARSFAQARVRIVVRDSSRQVVATGVRRADGAGRLHTILASTRPFPHRVAVSLHALVSPKLPVATRRASTSVSLS